MPSKARNLGIEFKEEKVKLPDYDGRMLEVKNTCEFFKRHYDLVDELGVDDLARFSLSKMHYGESPDGGYRWLRLEISGGQNGGGNWQDYFIFLSLIVQRLAMFSEELGYAGNDNNVRLEGITCDVDDDVFDVALRIECNGSLSSSAKN